MSRSAHLAAERLAALADEPADAADAAHLAACDACREELAAYVALVAAARAEGAAAYAPPDPLGWPSDVQNPGAAVDRDEVAWAAIAGTLRAEGLVASDARPAAHPRGAARRAGRGAFRGRGAGRLAAGLVLAVGAGLAGRASATRGPWAATAAAAAPAAPSSPDAARRALARARQDYLQAAAVLAATDPAGDPAANLDDLAAAGAPGGADAGTGRAGPRPAAPPETPDAELLRARLAALDAMLPRVRAAAQAAPQDPAINHVYLTAYDAREAALRELGQAMPAGVRLTRY